MNISPVIGSVLTLLQISPKSLVLFCRACQFSLPELDSVAVAIVSMRLSLTMS